MCIRDSLCGAHGVVIPKRGGVGVTGTVMKASAGAAARLPIARVSNLAQAIRTIKEMCIRDSSWSTPGC